MDQSNFPISSHGPVTVTIDTPLDVSSSKTSTSDVLPAYSDLRTPSISDILAALEKIHLGDHFREMLGPLQEAGVNSLDAIISHSEKSLVDWTGLPLRQVTALCAYAQHWKKLDLVVHRGASEELQGDGSVVGNVKDHDTNQDTVDEEDIESERA